MAPNKPEAKRLSKRIAVFFFKQTLQLVGLTCRKKWIGLENVEKLRNSSQNWIYSIWHDNITIASYLLKKQNLVSLVSSSEDGSIAADILDSWGFQIVRGSSSKGGIKAILTMIKELKSGKCGAITPDGPRGPRYRLQNGILVIGQRTELPLVPFHVESTRQWVLNSWDQHKFPKPFSTLYICIGEPFFIPKDQDTHQLDETSKYFENIMLETVSTTLEYVNEEK